VVEAADEFIVALRPGLADVVATVREHAAAVRGLDLASAADGFTSPAGSKRAYEAIVAATARYDRLRAVYAALASLSGLGTGIESELTPDSLLRLYPRYRLHIGPRHVRPPWPTDGAARLVWFVEREAELWLPTRAEQAAAETKITAHVQAVANGGAEAAGTARFTGKAA
jgi:hypothetical protein